MIIPKVPYHFKIIQLHDSDTSPKILSILGFHHWDRKGTQKENIEIEESHFSLFTNILRES